MVSANIKSRAGRPIPEKQERYLRSYLSPRFARFFCYSIPYSMHLSIKNQKKMYLWVAYVVRRMRSFRHRYVSIYNTISFPFLFFPFLSFPFLCWIFFNNRWIFFNNRCVFSNNRWVISTTVEQLLQQNTMSCKPKKRC